MTTTLAKQGHHNLAERATTVRGSAYTIAYHKAIARRFLECVSAHDIDGILGFITPGGRG